MATEFEYGTWTPITITGLNSQASSSTVYYVAPKVSNATNKYTEVLVSGAIAASSTVVTGEAAEIHVIGAYDVATASDWGAGIGTSIDPTSEADETEGTNIVLSNASIVTTVTFDDAVTNGVHHWGPVGISGNFNGIIPEEWAIVIKWAGTGALHSSGHVLGYQGMKYAQGS